MRVKFDLSVCLIFVLSFCFADSTIAQVSDSRFKEYNQVFPTYPFSDPNPIPLLNNVYPYFRYDGFTSKPENRSWKVVELENDFIRVLILPEIGGKIWTAIEKSTNRPYIYYNRAVKFRDIAMRGPWTSGGLEANYGIIGHTPNCATPVDYKVIKNADGSVSCFIGVLDLLSRGQWRIEINLPRDKAYFSTGSFWYNTTGQIQPYYHWMNAGLKAAGNLEFIYPGTKYIGHDGEYEDWPVHKSGKNLAFYEQNNFGGPKSYHVFGKYANFSGAYWHDDKMGMVRYGAHDGKAGTKIWIWGLSQQGMIWEKLLTDTDGQYVELQSGRLFNQNSEGSMYTPFKHRSFEPYTSEKWQELWYPVLETEGMVEASEYGALNITRRNGYVSLRFAPVQFFNDTLEVTQNGKIVYSKPVAFEPLKTFSDSFRISGEHHLTAKLKTHQLTFNTDPEYNVLSRPAETIPGFDWNSAYGQYILGKEYMDMKSYPSAEKSLKTSIEKDPRFMPSRIQMAELLYRNMRYEEALDHIKTALRFDTHHGEANYYYGLINTALGNLTDARDGFDLATLSYAYRSPSYAQLGKIYLSEKNYTKSGTYARKAIDFNKYNIEALQLLAVTYRLTGAKGLWQETLNTIAQYDPLNHFVLFEKYVSEPSAENEKAIRNGIRNELPDETYLEYGIWYNSVNLPADAKTVFNLNKQSTEAQYWLAFLDGKKPDMQSMKPDFVFPFRSESLSVLETLLKSTDHWMIRYHLALGYLDKNRKEEAASLLASCGDAPAYAPFYAVRAGINKENTDTDLLKDLKKALSLDNQWRYHKLLAEYYIEKKAYAEALSVVEKFYNNNPGNYIMGMLYAKTLLLNKKYRETDNVLAKLEIIPFEGATEGRELYRESKLMQAIDMLQQKKYQKAVTFANQSMLWPEHLGVGKPYDDDIDLRLEQWIIYKATIASGKKTAAAKLLEEIIAFEPRRVNTISNFQASNALITTWALEQLKGKDEARNWLDAQISKFPANALLEWSKTKWKDPLAETDPVLLNNANTRMLDRLISIQ